MKKNILIIVNAVVYNRGSEALIRGLTKMCKEKNKEANITLVSSEPEFGKEVAIENVDNYVKRVGYMNKPIKRCIAASLRKLGGSKIADNMAYHHLEELAKKQDIIFMVGADNYDITYQMQENLYHFHSRIRKCTNAKMVLYDCSIDKRDVTDTLIKDLENFDAITVRESISYKNVKQIVPKEKLYFCVDPAFVLEKEEVELPEVFKTGRVVGVNVSNLITNPKYGSQAEKIVLAYKNMIQYILVNTDKNVVLVPHVMKNADLSTLRVLYADFKENARVVLIEQESYNAKQLKYIISNCDMFIGARTHATIAAYSSVVPTLVLGYSVKSRGIAIDIFGTEEKYVLPVGNLKSEEYLVEGFTWLYENKEQIQNTLKEVMPTYIEKAKEVTKILD